MFSGFGFGVYGPNPTPWSQHSPPPNCAGAMVSAKSVAKLEGIVGPVEFRHGAP